MSSVLKGDDDILSIMEEMSSQQGYTTNTTATSTINTKKRKTESNLSGFGDDATKKPSSITNMTNIIPPTNPQVELFRRRSYEKFKNRFGDLFLRMSLSAEESFRHRKKGVDDDDRKKENLWKILPSHSVLERWAFTSKLLERFLIQQATDNNKKVNEIGGGRGVMTMSTYEIRNLLIRGRQAGTLMDPLLLNPIMPPSSAKEGGREEAFSCSKWKNATHFSLLQEEIIFQWRREWKKIVGNANKEKKKKTQEEESDIIDSEFFKSKMFKKRINRLYHQITELAQEVERNDFWSTLQKCHDAYPPSSFPQNNKKRRRMNKHIPKITFQHDDDDTPKTVTISYSGLTLHLNYTHYHKLHSLYHSQPHHHNDDTSQSRFNFAMSLFILLCRYDTLQGCGLQSSLNEYVFQYLHSKFGCRFECFASPFNCRHDDDNRYLSGFVEDIDGDFGSRGNFFEFDFLEECSSSSDGCCFQANPPFCSEFIHQMCTRMNEVLLLSNDAATTSSSPLMFIVFIPAWIDTDGYQTLLHSPVMTRYFVLSQKHDRHYYAEGTQHRRKMTRTNNNNIKNDDDDDGFMSLYRVASFDTAVFFLQNQAAKTKWPITDEIIKELKEAFGRTHSTPSQEEEEEEKIKKKKNEKIMDSKKRGIAKLDMDGNDSKKKRSKKKKKKI